MHNNSSKQQRTKTKTPTTAPKICCGDAGIMIKQANNISIKKTIKQTQEYKRKSPATAPKTWCATNDYMDIRMLSLENILSKVILSALITNNNLVFYKSNMYKPLSNGYVMSLMPTTTKNPFVLDFDAINLLSSI